MKLFIAILLLSSGFIPAEFHPIDDLISLELTDLTGSGISDTSLEDKEKPYDGDLVVVTVENTGNLSEHVGFQVYLPDRADLLHFKSESSGPRENPKNEMIAKSSPLENADNDEDVNVYEMQTASTRSKLKSKSEIGYSFNYEVESSESKQTNQFLAILDIFSENPETLKIKLNSANFGYGTYPDGSKHRWLMRTHPGYSLSVDVKEIDLEKDLDALTVHDVQSSGKRKLLSEVSVAKRLDTFSNRVLVTFKSDCSVNRGGFTAVVSVSKNKRKTCETPEELENGYFVVSDDYVTYYCDDDYVMVGDVTTLTCSGGTFEPSLADSNIRCVAECTPPVLSGGSYAFKSRSSDSGDGSVVSYNDVITYTCDVTHTMDASVTSADLICGADGSMATLAIQNIKCNKKCITVPFVNNTKISVNGSASVTEVTHGSRIDYNCQVGFHPTNTQSVFCGTIIPGQVDVSNITCSRREYRLKVVEQYMQWNAARKHCQDNGGDLIQYDTRLYTKSGRIEISQKLQMPYQPYRTGIRRSQTDKNVYIRSGDGVQIALTGWGPYYPDSRDGYDYLSWQFWNNEYKNTIFNNPDRSYYFICEY